MKLIYLFVLFFLPFFLSNGKSRIGEYYLGFGYGTVDDSDGLFDGDSFNFFTNSLASDSVDLNFHYTYSGLDTNSSKETFWKLGIGMRYHFDHFYDNDGMFRPFLGAGLQYFDDSGSLLHEEDGFGWTVELGAELSFTQNVSFLFYSKLYGLWKDFRHNDFEINSELNWWLDEENAISIAYLRAIDAGSDSVFFKYMYSWR